MLLHLNLKLSHHLQLLARLSGNQHQNRTPANVRMFRKQRTQVPALQFVIQDCVYPFRWAQENHYSEHSFLPQINCKRTASIETSCIYRKYEKNIFYNFLSDRNCSFNYSISGKICSGSAMPPRLM